MRRFQWSLQRLLDVTVQREQIIAAELTALMGEIAGLQRQVDARRERLKKSLSQLACKELNQRLGQQQVFMACSDAVQRQIEALIAKISQLRVQQVQKSELFLKIKAARQTLERLRQESLQRHQREQMNLEQKQLDETAQIAFARKLIEQTV